MPNEETIKEMAKKLLGRELDDAQVQNIFEQSKAIEAAFEEHQHDPIVSIILEEIGCFLCDLTVHLKLHEHEHFQGQDPRYLFNHLAQAAASYMTHNPEAWAVYMRTQAPAQIERLERQVARQGKTEKD